MRHVLHPPRHIVSPFGDESFTDDQTQNKLKNIQTKTKLSVKQTHWSYVRRNVQTCTKPKTKPKPAGLRIPARTAL